MAYAHFTIKASLAWWVKPYVYLTMIGVRLGLPINPEVVSADLMRGIRLKFCRGK